jgi:4-hydroxy-tetrahydrodipicolinate synthase
MEKVIQGVYSALLTPRLADDSIDGSAVARLVEFQVSRGIRSYAINGATGEFCLTTPQQLKDLFAAVLHVTRGDGKIVCGVGGAGVARVLELAKVAENEGATALLVPAPYFFPYEQDDVRVFFETVASRVNLPIVLYNLPQFTSGLHSSTACQLIRDVPNIIGIKDSSGSLDILRTLTDEHISCCRIVGNDSALAQAIREGDCDGVVSGVACVLPELIQTIFNRAPSDSDSFSAVEELLTQFIRELDVFPTPWGLRWALEALGIAQAWSAQPVSARRLEQSRRFMHWFQTWHSSHFPQLSVPIAQ